MYDVASSPNDPTFILHHLMVDCILVEWLKRHPNGEYPVDDLVRDGHRKDDYIRTFFPLITNGEAFYDTTQFGYYCELPNLGSTKAVGMKYFVQLLQWNIRMIGTLGPGILSFIERLSSL